MAEMGRRGGRAQTYAKAAAARENGLMGGRPSGKTADVARFFPATLDLLDSPQYRPQIIGMIDISAKRLAQCEANLSEGLAIWSPKTQTIQIKGLGNVAGSGSISLIEPGVIEFGAALGRTQIIEAKTNDELALAA